MNKRAGMIGLLIVAMGVLPMVVAAQENAAVKAQRIAMAERAARADAIRKLAERIMGLQINSTTTVQDFVTEDDRIETDVNAFIKGMKPEGKPEVDEDGVVTVKMSVTLKSVVTQLKKSYKAYYKGDRVRITDFDSMTQSTKLTKIVVIGSGVMKSEFADEPMAAPNAPARVRSTLPPFWKQNIPVQNRGQAKLMAQRAARADALRRLAERIKGTRITSNTTVQDFVTDSDQVNLDMRTFLRGAKELGVRYRKDSLICEVKMQVTLKTVLTSFKSWADVHYNGDKVNIKKLQDYTRTVKFTKIIETGTGVVNPRFVAPAVQKRQTQLAGFAAQPPAWISETLRAKGQAAVDTNMANPVQAKLMAYRAAELDARRKLAEKLNGLKIKSRTSVGNFVAQSDEIQSKMKAFQTGAQVIDSSKTCKEGMAEVTVELELKQVWNMILFYQQRGIPMP